MSGLLGQAELFTQRVDDVLRASLPDVPQTVALNTGNRVVVTSQDDRRIPLSVSGEVVAGLSFRYHLALDRDNAHLKTSGSTFALHSTLDRQPLIRCDYNAEMNTEPMAHWQIHAERGAFSSMLTMAHRSDPKRVKAPHMLSSLHIPVGGGRFRPCIEDIIELAIRDCGADSVSGWQRALHDSRQVWRTLQLRTVVSRHQVIAAEELRAQGWRIDPPCDVDVMTADVDVDGLRRW
ncbi:hypothetical protein [Agromyces archimandritae]|uniref:Uncharacterized protein n=1 Tax=Agromyces archimandritae TaxID=2781962 RepID=A0A975FLY0_9MICO|nr:hypothetical protein [Agromyces archimandritae]QTX03391.1 hypothetical protein G127AT_08360 [Agromyces archimandritae]